MPGRGFNRTLHFKRGAADADEVSALIGDALSAVSTAAAHASNAALLACVDRALTTPAVLSDATDVEALREVVCALGASHLVPLIASKLRRQLRSAVRSLLPGLPAAMPASDWLRVQLDHYGETLPRPLSQSDPRTPAFCPDECVALLV